MLKLYINESAYMLEDIDAVKKYYPNIDDNTFMNLIALDPTYRDGSNSVGKYGKWILNLYNKGTISENDFNDLTNLLNQFNIYKNRIQNKDLNSYKTLDALADTLGAVIDDDSMLTDRQKLRFLKNVKAGKVSTSAENDYDIVLDTPNFIVYVPNTHEASMKLGNGTEWCTAHENPDWYNHYVEDSGKLYIVKNKKSGERWQYSDLEGDFLDENDNEFNILELMKQDEKLSKFFEKFLGIDCYNFDGTWVYDGNEIPKQFKSDITKIIIDKNVTKIGKYAFWNCKNLTAITIPNSVIEIENWAFSDCANLTSINIPNSVTEIGHSIFSGCYSLTSINIPNSVTEIRGWTFNNCSGLTSINIPNSVTKIGECAFCDCDNLTSINIPNSVTEMEHRVFYRCNDLTVYTNNSYVIDYCKTYSIPTKPLNNNESYTRKLRLHIREN